MKVLGRLAYGLAVLVFGLPAIPFVVTGFAVDEDSSSGYFTTAGYGLLFWLFVFSLPLLLVASGAKWVVTGRGLGWL